ncbi:HFX_2341 family transcriptional regulator domain-containing protein [Haloplanus aerogenes]|uniref:Uncharacterized protein n=1 Tax=Haloplanus aerogenes TaxID=660522 RepID=A0A3M0DPM9_9EURY|nr:DUF6293 family protein [Haloplanus aerogenes]AZH24632.1 hypothetical protein DU502_04195 [Haloplanus aerogenes]RMB23712.1 hypothetical protein ATH50_0937 [Haloplanus aerogenes]
MNVAERVHVMPLGFEHDRIVEPAREYRADRVILLDWLADDIERPAYHDDVLADLDAAGIDAERRDCDLFDLYDSIAVIAEIVTDEATPDDADDVANDVYVNLATGSKITAIGGMIACMVTGAATPYYVRAERYASGTEPVGYGMELAIDLPTYPMDRPDYQQIAVLDRLADEGPCSKKELIRFGAEWELPFVDDCDRPFDAAGKPTKQSYARLRRHVVEPLEERGFVTVESVGTTRQVRATEAGRNARTAFGYVLD